MYARLCFADKSARLFQETAGDVLGGLLEFYLFSVADRMKAFATRFLRIIRIAALCAYAQEP